MKYRSLTALLAALLCVTCSCSKKKNDTSEAPEPETTQSAENDIPADASPALEQPFLTLSYEDFTEVNYNISTIEGEPGIVRTSYVLPEYTEHPDADMIWRSEPVFDGSKVYFATDYGKLDPEYMYDESGSMNGVTTHTVIYDSPLCCLDLDTSEIEYLAEDYFEALVPTPDMSFDKLLTVQNGYIYYTVLEYEYGDHEAEITAYGLWLMKVNIETMEKVTIGKQDMTPFMQDGHLLAYKTGKDEDIYEFNFDTDSWDVLIEDYTDKGYLLQEYITNISDLCFDDELGMVTFVPQNGEKERTVTTNKYTIKTKLRSGQIVYVTDKMAVIYNAGDSTLHVYDTEKMERYSIELTGLSSAQEHYYDSNTTTYYGGYWDNVLPCGSHMLLYSIIGSMERMQSGETEYYGTSSHVTAYASFFLPEYGVCYPMGTVTQSGNSYVHVGTYGDSAYFFSDNEIVFISEETPQ